MSLSVVAVVAVVSCALAFKADDTLAPGNLFTKPAGQECSENPVATTINVGQPSVSISPLFSDDECLVPYSGPAFQIATGN